MLSGSGCCGGGVGDAGLVVLLAVGDLAAAAELQAEALAPAADV